MWHICLTVCRAGVVLFHQIGSSAALLHAHMISRHLSFFGDRQALFESAPPNDNGKTGVAILTSTVCEVDTPSINKTPFLV